MIKPTASGPLPPALRGTYPPHEPPSASDTGSGFIAVRSSPTYLRMPRRVRENWRHYAGRVRSLCIEAIRQRPRRRTYIRWLESQIADLPEYLPALRTNAPEQLSLRL